MNKKVEQLINRLQNVTDAINAQYGADNDNEPDMSPSDLKTLRYEINDVYSKIEILDRQYGEYFEKVCAGQKGDVPEHVKLLAQRFGEAFEAVQKAASAANTAYKERDKNATKEVDM